MEFGAGSYISQSKEKESWRLKVDIPEIKQIYEKYMVNDFPAAELKPFMAIESLIKRHSYKCFALDSQASLTAYAFLYFNDSQRCFLLDYFAVIATKRGRGYGSQFLTLLKKKLFAVDGFLVEVEKLESAEKEQEREEREKRLHFYKEWYEKPMLLLICWE